MSNSCGRHGPFLLIHNNSIAGSDSTSGALRAIFYFLMKHPSKMERLTQEIDDAFQNSTLTSPVQYNQATKLPYLMAVIQESLRLFPPFGVPMPRYVPNGGLQLFSHHIPVGFKIGMNAMVTQFDESVFGEDAREFRPERWLVNDAQYRAMQKAMLVFGAGTRTCIGKHVSATNWGLDLLSRLLMMVLCLAFECGDV